MRVVVVIARGVLAAAEHEFVVLHLLGAVRDDVPFALFRDHVADVGFLRLEVVRHCTRLVTLFAVLENRQALHLVFYRVIYACSVDGGRVHLGANVVGREVHGAVFDVAAAVQIGCAVAPQYNRVVGFVFDRRVNGLRGRVVVFFLRLSGVEPRTRAYTHTKCKNA